VPRSLVYPTLLSALRMQGIAVIEGESVVRVVPETEAKLQGGPVARGAVTAGGDRMVTQVIPLRYESAAQLVNVLRPMITPSNTIAAFPGANALVITDYADNLKRLEKVIASLDQPPGGEPMVVPVRHASAIDIVPTITKLLADPRPRHGGRAAARDGRRRRALEQRADPVRQPGRAARVRHLIEQLDTPGAPAALFIVYLKNAEAARVVQTLRAVLTGQESSPSGGASSSPPSSMQPTTSQTTGSTMGTNPPLPFTSAPAAASFSAGGATISADTANNALVILAPEPVYNNLRAIIEKLDVRRAQVYVEALIVEVSADKAAEFGIQWQALTGVNSTQTRVIGGTNFTPRGSGSNIVDIAANLGSAGQGLNLGVIRGTINIPGSARSRTSRSSRARSRRRSTRTSCRRRRC
jgi:general secretion pathway protein D